MTSDTIFALSSGMPPAAIAVIRLSGPQAAIAARALCGTLPPERHAGLRTLRNPSDGSVLDQALVLAFGAERSVTGEPLVEFQCHGGRAVVAAVMDALSAMDGLRGAQPGEFTRRSLENGRMGLNEVEGLSDLLHAETQAQRRAAQAMYGGAFSARIEYFQHQTLRALAFVEASLDFADETDVEGEEAVFDRAGPILRDVLAEMKAELSAPPAERLREGIRLVIAGPVNSGKSTLLNRLVGYEAAIVTDIEGTTRDRIEVPVALNGVPWLLTDTAGFRDSDDTVERIGMARAREAVANADLLLWLGDPGDAPRPDAILVLSRADRLEAIADPRHHLVLSALTGAGMAELLALLAERAGELLPQDRSYLLSARQRGELGTAASSVDYALGRADPLLMAEDLRDALAAFDRLTGRASTEDMLDSLFSGFCIGK